jgi:hypothetical protein
MPKDDNQPLHRKFQSFSFSADGSSHEDTPKPQKPANDPNDISKLKYERYRGLGHTIEDMIDEDDMLAQQEYERDQDRAFEAARSFLPFRKEIRAALDSISNLHMQAVIAAGILEETYRGRMPDQNVDNMIVAALCFGANNFDDIADRLTPEAVGMVDELLMMAEEEDEGTRLQIARGIEPDTKRVFLANAIADLDMITYEIDNDTADAAPPHKKEHDLLAAFIMETTYGVDNKLIDRAVTSFNTVSRAAKIDTLLQQNARHEVEINAFADIKIENAAAIDEFTATPKSAVPKSKPKKPKSPGK